MNKFQKGDLVHAVDVSGTKFVLNGLKAGVTYEVTDVVEDHLRLDGGAYGYKSSRFELVETSPEETNEDAVNHPAHYTSDPSGVECIQVTRHRNFNIGNAIKYLWRAGLKKDAYKADIDKQVEDLNKAIFYIKDEITRLQEAK